MDEKHIDPDIALEKLGGSYKLLRILLVGFVVKHAKVDEEIQTLSMMNQYEEAQRIAHSIKGLSGNLGAEKLKEKSYVLEKVYENNPSEYERPLEAFKNELHLVTEEVKSMLKLMEETKGEVAITDEDIRPVNRDDIRQFIDALDSFHYDRIEKTFDKFKNYLFTIETKTLCEKIIKLIDDYDYNSAKEVLITLLSDVETLNGGKNETVGSS